VAGVLARVRPERSIITSTPEPAGDTEPAPPRIRVIQVEFMNFPSHVPLNLDRDEV
jgi:hypothetical protein